MSNPQLHIDSITMDSTSAYPEITGYVTGDYSTIINNPDHTIDLGRSLTTTGSGTINIYDYPNIYKGYTSSNISIDRNCQGSMEIYGDLTVHGKIKTPDGEISKVDLDEEDTILLTVDPEQYDAETCMNILQVWQQAFPNHKVVMTVKGIKIDFIKEKGRKKEEVSW